MPYVQNYGMLTLVVRVDASESSAHASEIRAAAKLMQNDEDAHPAHDHHRW